MQQDREELETTDGFGGEFSTHYGVRQNKTVARHLRAQPTPTEEALWQALRNRQLGGLKFLRQHPIGPSVVDFYCHEKRLVVEVDGGIHRQQDVRDWDEARQKLIEHYEVRFFRCTTEDIEHDLAGVLEQIATAANRETHPLR